MSQHNQTIICDNCHECVPAGPFCFKCGAKQVAIVKQPSFEGSSVHNAPIQATDSLRDTEQNSGGNFCERIPPLSQHGPEIVTAQETNNVHHSTSATSFTIQMKPREENVQSGSSVSTFAGHAINDNSGNVRNGVNDMNAAEKLNKERADKEANKVMSNKNSYIYSSGANYQLSRSMYI